MEARRRVNSLGSEAGAPQGTAPHPEAVVETPRPSGPLERFKPRGVTRVLRACVATWRGLAGAFREEAAFRQELLLAAFVIPAGIWLGRTGVERAMLVAPMLLVLVVELLNSAIEAAIDRIGFERHALAGLAKDLGSAAVFVSLVLLTTVWVLVLGFR